MAETNLGKLHLIPVGKLDYCSYAVSLTGRRLFVILFFLLIPLLISWKKRIHLRQQKITNIGGNDRMFTEQALKKTKVSFLKVRKAGSSTLACIFLRFGVNNNLSMFLPRQPFISDIEQSRLLKKHQKYDIFVIHTYYNYTFFKNIVDSPILIAIIRRPEERIISHTFFFKLNKKYKSLQGISRQNVINRIVENTSKYDLDNTISIFFGLKDLNISETSLQHYLTKLNSEFSLVIILERLDECLVLLKRFLNWSVYDIIYKAKKTRRNNDIYLSKQQMKRLKYTNRLEYAIYAFFYKELEKKIQNAKNNFTGEVAHFKGILEQTDEFCLNPYRTFPYHYFPSSKWDNNFSITETDCFLIYKADVKKYKILYGQKVKNTFNSSIKD